MYKWSPACDQLLYTENYKAMHDSTFRTYEIKCFMLTFSLYLTQMIAQNAQ